jgi:hypothetical protein
MSIGRGMKGRLRKLRDRLEQMNIRRGILRLTLVLSILAAIILPLCLMEKHPWVTCGVTRYGYTD